MAHPVYTAKFCSLGHKVTSRLVDASKHNRTTKEEVAAELNKELGLKEDEDLAAVYPNCVEDAIRSGAFDSATRAFGDFRGRYGGIREAEAPAAPKNANKKD